MSPKPNNYILTHPAMPDMVKIWMSHRDCNVKTSEKTLFLPYPKQQNNLNSNELQDISITLLPYYNRMPVVLEMNKVIRLLSCVNDLAIKVFPFFNKVINKVFPINNFVNMIENKL